MWVSVKYSDDTLYNYHYDENFHESAVKIK